MPTLIAIYQHSPGGIFSRCIQRLSGVCSETAFDMQRLLQVHALRQVGAAELGVCQGIVGIAPASPEEFDRGALRLLQLQGQREGRHSCIVRSNRISINTRSYALYLRRKVASLWPCARDADRMSGEWV